MKNETETNIGYWWNGNISNEHSILNDVRHGIQKNYYSTGKISYLCLQAHGQRQGIELNWHMNSTRQSLYQNNNDQQHGLRMHFVYK